MASKRVFARMNKTPKFSSRRCNRCQITGRSRGVYRKFGVSRIVLRELALQGKIPRNEKGQLVINPLGNGLTEPLPFRTRSERCHSRT